MTSPADAQASGELEREDDAFAANPEMYVGAAFAGGLLLALILRKLGPDE